MIFITADGGTKIITFAFDENLNVLLRQKPEA